MTGPLTPSAPDGVDHEKAQRDATLAAPHYYFTLGSFATANLARAYLDLSRQMAWRPIEEAPKDGTLIDLWANGHRYPNCRWARHDPDSNASWGKEHWNGLPWGRRGSYPEIEPTHWMPLRKEPTP